MKITELISEAKGPEMSRRGFLGNLMAAAASKGVDPTGLVKLANKIKPDILPTVERIIDWIGPDQSKLDVLDDAVYRRDRISSADEAPIRNAFFRMYAKKHPKSTYQDRIYALDDYMTNLRDHFKDNSDGYLEAMRDLKGGPLIIDELNTILRDSGIGDLNQVKDMIRTEYETNPNIGKLFTNAWRYIEKHASELRATGVAAAQAKAKQELEKQALHTAKQQRGALRNQIEKAKKLLSNQNSDPDKAKFAITQQLSAVQNKVAAIENADTEIVQAINAKCEWIKSQLDSTDNPDVTKAIITQLEHIDTLLEQLQSANDTVQQPD